MNRRKIVTAVLALGLVVSPVAVTAQQQAKVPRIGLLDPGVPHFFAAFRQGMRDLGYVEAQNISYMYRSAEGKSELIPGLAAELVRLRVDVIVAGGTPAARAAKAATTTIPIVVPASGDPVGTGLVASLARPGGNLTGLSDYTVDVSAKRLELLREIAPTASRIAVLWNPTNPTNLLQARETQAGARSLGLSAQSVEVQRADELEGAFAAMARERAGALLVMADPFLFLHRSWLADLAARHRLPAIYPFREHVDSGGLMSYGASLPDLFRRAATYVDKILKGAKPADLPVEQATRFELFINLKTAKALGITIPQSVLIRADQVIQ